MILAVILAACGGLIVGGAVTMLAERTVRGEPLSFRSRCGSCEARLGILETIPLLSWCWLSGRCRYCAERISLMHPGVEAASAGLWVAVVLRFGWGWQSLAPLVAVGALIALSVVDLHSYRLPDRLVFWSLGLSVAALLPGAAAAGDLRAVRCAIMGMFGYFGLLLAVHLISPKGLGFGDVKLALLLGLHLGWAAAVAGPGRESAADWLPVARLVFWAQLLASMLGLLGGLSLGLLRRRLNRDVLGDPQADPSRPTRLLESSFPFGPALACGAMTVVLFAESVPGA
ncbi:MAG: prepilin peptidase [Acidimicrobiaceae bacterium]|nr:prepilin peptidase [Acidimicrobiia bacterium]MCY4493013.1 prepilin peptidase [Acidimicrobiaceae bacterium]